MFSLREGRQTQADATSPPAIGTNGDRLKRAKEAVDALQGSDDTPVQFRKVWQEFRQAFEDTVNNNSNSDTHQSFPVWALSEFDPGDLEDFLTAGYSQDLKHLRLCAPSAPSHLSNRPWKFILYFDHIERQRAIAINDICIKRPSLSFNELYEKVQANRLKRIKNHKNPKYEFLPRDFKACLKEIDRDSSDATINNGFNNARQRKIKREGRSDNSNSYDHPAPVGNTNFDGCEDDYTADQGDQEDDLEELSSLLNNMTRSPIRPRVSKSPIIIHGEADEMDGDGEPATPITSTPQAANRELSREQSSPLDPLLGEGIFSSIEEQLFQEKRSILLDYERLKASLQTANKTTETCIKSLEEENAAYTEKATRVLSNQNASYEDMQPALDRISYRVANNNKKRKIWEDDNEKRKRLVAELENPEIQAYFKNDSL